jgi:hypothetical protein
MDLIRVFADGMTKEFQMAAVAAAPAAEEEMETQAEPFPPGERGIQGLRLQVHGFLASRR